MCGRFVAATDADGLVKLFMVDERQVDDVPPSYNVAPTDPVLAIVEHDQRRHLVLFRWGLVPQWAQSPRVGAPMINARAETAADKPAFRDALSRRRCLIPADGFYEWQRVDGQKLPWFVHPADHRPVAFAGLWATWQDPGNPQAPPVRSCTILTGPAAGVVADLHDRMPLVLPEAEWDRWLDRSLTDRAAVSPLTALSEEPGWKAHRVSTTVNSVASNGPDLVTPVPQ